MDDEEIQNPPTTHLVSTVDDLTDVLDYDSEDIDGMDDDAGDDQEPAPNGHWKATPTHDVYMVDTPKGSDNEEMWDVAKDNSPTNNQSGDAGAARRPASIKTEPIRTRP